MNDKDFEELEKEYFRLKQLRENKKAVTRLLWKIDTHHMLPIRITCGDSVCEIYDQKQKEFLREGLQKLCDYFISATSAEN